MSARTHKDENAIVLYCGACGQSKKVKLNCLPSIRRELYEFNGRHMRCQATSLLAPREASVEDRHARSVA